ncbi:MAG: thiol oxidoreductase [Chitinophagaceae bacterium]|nr:thiol oxidoreductase [Chitinophagaceae bacterium]
MKPKLLLFLLPGLMALAVYSCTKLEPAAPVADTVMDAPLDGMTSAQYKLFNEGAGEFDEVYHTETGLGPVFVATSCGSCHAGDNRGHLFTILTRFGQPDTAGNRFLAMGGPQLQNRAIQGHSPEEIPAGATSSKFTAPIASGVGFLELVSDADIIAMAEANITHPDGVRGHPNWNTIPDYVIPFPDAVSKGGKYICRFGRKASTYNLHQQTVQAFNQDIGVTTSFLPNNPFNYLSGLNPVQTADPEISDASVNATVFYLQGLQAPIQRDQNDAQVVSGKNIFINIGCESCHRQTLKTGFSPIEPLSYQEFHPYTDLLVHDMGVGLNDHYTEGTAKPSEWRTTPLWGLGLAGDAQGGNLFLMHDGRALSIEDAILMHGGEAEVSATRFMDLSQPDKDALLKFLKSL